MKIKHIYWFAHYDLNCPSSRYRGKYPLDRLKEDHGITHNFIFPSRTLNGILKFLRFFLAALLFRKDHSLIVIQKVCTNGLYAKALKLLVTIRSEHTLYDIDDAEYYRNEVDTLHYFLKNCSSVSVGSDALFDYCSKFNAKVFLQTSPVTDHGIRKLKRNEKLNIGWVGDFGNGKKETVIFSHKTSLFKLFFPSLLTIEKPIKVTLIGVKKPSDIPEIQRYFRNHPHIELDIPTGLNWENDKWLYSKIAEFDIGVAPMVDHPFTCAKSAFKAKQCLSCGVPVLANGIGETEKFVLDDINGIICNDVPSFTAAINRFIEMDDTQYNKFSTASLSDTRNYSISNYCKTLLMQYV